MGAKNGQKGCKWPRINGPDWFFLDMGLPLMYIHMPLGVGYSVARRLNHMGHGCMPIIFITASREQGLQEAARAVGAAGFFEKPYDAEELLRAIAQILHPAGPGRGGPGAAARICPPHQPGIPRTRHISTDRGPNPG